jgi:hypothetical protein
VSSQFTRKALHQVLPQSAIALLAVSKSDPIIFHTKAQLIISENLPLDQLKAQARGTDLARKGRRRFLRR